MSSLKSQLFQQYANEGLKALIREYQQKYEPKKEERFNYNGITYEIGTAQTTEDRVEFEISSKIPQDELSSKVTLQDYFKSIKGILVKASVTPDAIDMENITRELGGDERKERDYVKLKYSYIENDLYDEQELLKKVESISSKGESKEISQVSGATTLIGKMILLAVKESIYSKAMENMQNLIDANETVRVKAIWSKKK
jgi:hypothetical protein